MSWPKSKADDLALILQGKSLKDALDIIHHESETRVLGLGDMPVGTQQDIMEIVKVQGFGQGARWAIARLLELAEEHDDEPEENEE